MVLPLVFLPDQPFEFVNNRAYSYTDTSGVRSEGGKVNVDDVLVETTQPSIILLYSLFNPPPLHCSLEFQDSLYCQLKMLY